MRFASDKFEQRTNIPKLSENTKWELTAQILEMCTLDIMQFTYIYIYIYIYLNSTFNFNVQLKLLIHLIQMHTNVLKLH